MVENSLIGHIIVFILMFITFIIYELAKIYLKRLNQYLKWRIK